MKTFLEYRAATTLANALQNIANDLYINNVKSIEIDLDFLDLLKEAAKAIEMADSLEVIKILKEAKDSLNTGVECCHAEEAVSDAEFALDKAIRKIKGVSRD